jgi:hypothetical protein
MPSIAAPAASAESIAAPPKHWSGEMTKRTRIAILIYSMTQAVLFGAGVVIVLSTPLQTQAAYLIPAVIVLTATLAAPLAYVLAPRLMTSADSDAGLPAPLNLTACVPYARRARPMLQQSTYANPNPRTEAKRETKKFG